MISVYIVDDSRVARDYLRHLLEADPSISVIGEASSGEEAVEFMQANRPDVITMDINMPGMDGHEATSMIMGANPVPIVIVSAHYDKSHVEQSFRAIEAGAIAIVEKPPGPGHPAHKEAVRELIQTVKLMSEVKVVRRWARGVQKPSASRAFRTEKKEVKVVVIGASAGGPPVLQTVLSGFEADFPVPIVVVQHIARGFIDGMVEWLGGVIEMKVSVASDGERLLPGHIYFAPDGFHAGVEPGGTIVLSQSELENGIRPSVSYLFRSAARAFGAEVIGVLLTGMGRDGALELRFIKDRGGVTIVQDRETAVVYGMPGEAIKMGGASLVLTPEMIPVRIKSLVNGRWPD